MLILWDTKYLSRYERFARVYTAQYPPFWDSVLAILHAKSGTTKTTNNLHAVMLTYWCALSPFEILSFLTVFSILLSFFPPFWIGHFRFGFFWVTRWCALPVAWWPDIDVLSSPFPVVSFLSAFLLFSFILSQNWQGYCMNAAIIDHFSTGIRTVDWMVTGKGL